MATHFVGNLWYPASKAAYWTNQVFETSASRTEVAESDIRGSQVTVEFSRATPAGTREDLATMTLHLVVCAAAGAAPFSRLGPTQMADVEADLDTWWTTMKVNSPPAWTLSGYRWRHYGADQPVGDTGLKKPSPVVRYTARSVAGTAGGIALPYQVSSTFTLKTGSRRHWGRNYMPGISATELGTNGRLSATYRSVAAQAIRDLYNALYANTAETNIMVWSPKYWGILSVEEIHLDDVPDIQRRRRGKQVASIASYTS